MCEDDNPPVGILMPIIADRKAATTALQTPAEIAQEIKDLFEDGE